MIADRERDAYADAVLISILRFLVACIREREDPLGSRVPVDGVLTESGVETIDEILRSCQSVALFATNGHTASTQADEAYREHRRTIDPLWRYVEAHGLTALHDEATRRLTKTNLQNAL